MSDFFRKILLLAALIAWTGCGDGSGEQPKTCESESDCDSQTQTQGQLCVLGECRPCSADDQCRRRAYYGTDSLCFDSACTGGACPAGQAGCSCKAGACDGDLICDAHSQLCRAVRTCDDCAPNQRCDAGSAGEDATCLAECLPGFSWNTNTESCDPVAATCLADDPQSILDQCQQAHRACEEDGENAHCGDCVAGTIERDGSCVEATCENLGCAEQHRECQVDQNGVGACTGCTAGYIEEGGQCRALVTCATLVLPCGQNQRCVEATDTRDAYCTGDNVPPTAADSSVELFEDGSVQITPKFSDPNLGDDPVVRVKDTPTHGTLSGSHPTFTYTPAPDFSGQDAFTFEVDDGEAVSNVGTVRITVVPVNDPPDFTAADHALWQTEGPTIEISGWASVTSVGPVDEVEAGQAPLAFSVAVTDPGLFVDQPTVAVDGTLRLTHADNPGSTLVLVTLRDDGGTEHGGVDAVQKQFQITVKPNTCPRPNPYCETFMREYEVCQGPEKAFNDDEDDPLVVVALQQPLAGWKPSCADCSHPVPAGCEFTENYLDEDCSQCEQGKCPLPDGCDEETCGRPGVVYAKERSGGAWRVCWSGGEPYCWSFLFTFAVTDGKGCEPVWSRTLQLAVDCGG